MNRSMPLAAACLSVLLLGTSDWTRAGIILTATEVGSDVIISGGGTANLSDLTLNITGTGQPAVVPNIGVVGVGVASPSVEGYEALSGPGSFGPGGQSLATSGTGDLFGISTDFSSLLMVVPANYVSGTALSGTATFVNASFASLGMTPGTYVWTWGSGVNADSFTLNIGSVVPEPSSLTLMGIAVLCGLCSQIRRRKRTT